MAEAKEEVAGMKRKLKEEEKENRKLTKQIEKKDEKLESVRSEKKKKHDRLGYHQAKRDEAKTSAKQEENVDQLRRQLDEEVRKNVALTTENEMLRGLCEDKEKDIEKLEEEQQAEVDMMNPDDRRQYKPEVVEWVWELLRENVAHHQVPKVIESSFKFFGKKASQIPSVPIVNNMAKSCLPAAQKQMGV